MRTAIIGSRSYNRLDLVEFFVRTLVPTTIVVSGGAVGVDATAEAEVKRLGLQTLIYLPDYHKYQKRAPLIRNDEIVKASDRLVAFWDLTSPGTRYTVQQALKTGLLVHVFGPDGNQVRI